jgi:hypothetical protein
MACCSPSRDAPASLPSVSPSAPATDVEADNDADHAVVSTGAIVGLLLMIGLDAWSVRMAAPEASGSAVAPSWSL